MRRSAALLILILIFLMVMGSDLFALTFEFNKDKPGVQTFALKYLRFSVGRENLIPMLPPAFYVLYDSSDDIPVLAAKVGKIEKTSGISPYLDKIAGGDKAKSIAGPHGEKILYNPGMPPAKKALSSYVLWEEWLLIGNRKETLSSLLKLYKNPSDIAKVEKSASSSLKEWKGAGIRLWGDNSNDRLYRLFESQKKRMLIPLIKDPKKIHYMAGAFILTEAKEMSGALMITPEGRQAGKDIESDLRFIAETIRRRLVAIKVPYKGQVHSTDNGVVYETYIGNYLAAQGQIVQAER